MDHQLDADEGEAAEDAGTPHRPLRRPGLAQGVGGQDHPERQPCAGDEPHGDADGGLHGPGVGKAGADVVEKAKLDVMAAQRGPGSMRARARPAKYSWNVR